MLWFECCILPNLYVEVLTPQCDGIWRSCPWVKWGHWGWGPHDGISAPIRRHTGGLHHYASPWPDCPQTQSSCPCSAVYLRVSSSGVCISQVPVAPELTGFSQGEALEGGWREEKGKSKGVPLCFFVLSSSCISSKFLFPQTAHYGFSFQWATWSLGSPRATSSFCPWNPGGAATSAVINLWVALLSPAGFTVFLTLV